MEYIITDGHSFFCGWDPLGQMKFVSEARLAYRMRKRVADTTLAKISSKMDGFRIAVA